MRPKQLIVKTNNLLYVLLEKVEHSMRTQLEMRDEKTGARNSKLIFDQISVACPTRIVNISEIRTFKILDLENQLPTPIFEYIKFIDANKINKLQKVNGVMSQNVSLALRESRHLHRMGKIKFFPKIPLELQLTYDDLITLTDFQVFSNMDIIAYPDYKVRAHPYLKNLDKIAEYINSKGFGSQVMPYVNTAHRINVFEAKVKGILDRGYSSIGLEIRGGLSIYPQLTFIQRQLNDKNIWIHASNVSPRYPRSNLSHVHLLPYFGIDTFARTIFLPPMKPMMARSVTRFDALTLGLLKYQSHREKYGRNLHCNCPVCIGRDLEGFYHGTARQIVLRTKAHDVIASSLEFAKARDRITYGEFREYLRDKEHAKPVVGSLEAVSRRRLDEWT